MNRIVLLHLCNHIILLLLTCFIATAQISKDLAYFYINENDRFLQIENDEYLDVFFDEAGLQEKQYMDSIKLGLASPFRTDSVGKIIWSDNNSILPWNSYRIIELDITVNKVDFNKMNFITKEEFIELSKHRERIKAVIRDIECNEYRIVDLLPLIQE